MRSCVILGMTLIVCSVEACAEDESAQSDGGQVAAVADASIDASAPSPEDSCDVEPPSCPDGSVCESLTGRCVEPRSCPDAPRGAPSCSMSPLPTAGLSCDPTLCSGYDFGTCWLDCICSRDGTFRWGYFECTE
jgi:hypothetical protein